MNFLASDMKWLNHVAQQLDAELKQEASLFHFKYAIDLTAYTGHYLCEKASDVHAVSVPVVISFHPTDVGQRPSPPICGEGPPPRLARLPARR